MWLAGKPLHRVAFCLTERRDPALHKARKLLLVFAQIAPRKLRLSVFAYERTSDFRRLGTKYKCESSFAYFLAGF